MPELEYWNVGIPQTERVNRGSLKWLAEQQGFHSVGRFLVSVMEEHFNRSLTIYQNKASDYASSHKGDPR